METNENKKVLMISYFFPPNNTIGAVRIGKLARYLPEFGWSPLVLTVDKPSGISQTLPIEINKINVVRTSYFTFSDMLLRKLEAKYHYKAPKEAHRKGAHPKGADSLLNKIVRFGNPFVNLPIINELVFDPIGWYRPAVKAGLELIKSKEVNIIFSSSNPCISHLVAARLHKITDLPWVAEFRDPWSSNPYVKNIQPFSYFEKQWEKRTLNKANLLISISQTLAANLEKLHSKPTVVITNGFDSADYNHIVPLTQRFSLTYTGIIYPGKRDPSLLFQALGELKCKGLIRSEDIEIRFFGYNIIKHIRPIAEKYGILDLVTMDDNIPFKESINKQLESTLLLLLSWNDPRDAGTLTGKIFEYLGANRPILAMAYPGGEIDKLLQKSGCGIVANDTEEIKRLILIWLDEFKRTGRIKTYFHPDSNIVNSYTRQIQARTLADVFDKVSI